MKTHSVPNEVKRRVEEAARAALGPIRSHSKKFVNFPPSSGIGLGNMLSFWLWAHAAQRRGHNSSVLYTEPMERWVREFPGVEPLLVRRSGVSLFCQRGTRWGQKWEEYDREDFGTFIQERILTAPRFRSLAGNFANDRTVVVNIRRGDYYSDPTWHQLYGFDIENYIRVALDGSLAQREVNEIRVVSDDVAWCRDHLAWLADASRHVKWVDNSGPMDDFVELCRARRLILTNSSFSYWGGYISSVIHGDNHGKIWVPEFHRRDLNGGAAWQLDPAWSIVRDIPGGWKLAD